MSDLHLEINLNTNMGEYLPADVLVIAGDFITVPFLKSYHGIMEHVKKNMFSKYKYILYVAGNHEFYKSFYEETRPFILNYFDDCKNFYYLEDQDLMIDDTLFIGSTLWTDFKKKNPVAMLACKEGMNDFHIVYTDMLNPRKFTPLDAYDIHKTSVSWITKRLKEYKNKKTVVVTHHAPHYNSLNSIHAGNNLDYAYASDLSKLILKNNQIKYWIHGHTHDSKDYNIGDTIVTSNQLGYRSEPTFKNFKQKVIEV